MFFYVYYKVMDGKVGKKGKFNILASILKLSFEEFIGFVRSACSTRFLVMINFNVCV